MSDLVADMAGSFAGLFLVIAIVAGILWVMGLVGDWWDRTHG